MGSMTWMVKCEEVATGLKMANGVEVSQDGKTVVAVSSAGKEVIVYSVVLYLYPHSDRRDACVRATARGALVHPAPLCSVRHAEPTTESNPRAYASTIFQLPAPPSQS